MWKPCVIKQHLEQLPGRKQKSSLQEDGGGMEQMQLTACSPAVQHSTNPLLPELKHAPETVPVAPYLHLLFEGDCSVPADTPGLCSPFTKLGCTIPGRVQYGSGRQDVGKILPKSSIPQKTSPNPTFDERAVTLPSTKRNIKTEQEMKYGEPYTKIRPKK